jgi:alpha-tubulin suppressor-like RCC1 family protein
LDHPVTKIVAGAAHHYLLDQGVVKAVGANGSRQLTGAQGAYSSAEPLTVPLPLAAYDVAAGGYHGAAVCSDGSVYCWGDPAAGQLGQGNTTAQTAPVLVNSGAMAGKKALAVACGELFTMALTEEGEIVAWGSNTSGELGIGTTVASLSPVLVGQGSALQGKRIVNISAGTNHALALDSQGVLYAWGLAQSLARSRNVLSPVVISQAPIGDPIEKLVGGHRSSYFITERGTAYGFGTNVPGLLNTSTAPLALTTAVQEISSSRSHTLVLKRNGDLFACGTNSYKELGTSSLSESTRLTAVVAVSAAQHIAAGTNFSVADNRLSAQLAYSYYEPLSASYLPLREGSVFDLKSMVGELVISQGYMLPNWVRVTNRGVVSTRITSPAPILPIAPGNSSRVYLQFETPSTPGQVDLPITITADGATPATLRFFLRVNVKAPYFKEQPRSQILALGSPLGFSTSALAWPDATYTWLKLLGTGTSIIGSRSTLDLGPATFAHTGRYRARLVTRSFRGSPVIIDSDPFTISVVDAATTRRALPERYSTVCSVKATGTGLSYQWEKDGQPITAGGRFQVLSGGQTLLIRPLELGDSGTYRCRISTPGAEDFLGGANELFVYSVSPTFQPESILLPDATVGLPYSHALQIQPDSHVESYSATGLPAGLTLNAKTGVISGRPRVHQVQPFDVILRAKNVFGTDLAIAQLTVQPFPAGFSGNYEGLIPRTQAVYHLGGRFSATLTEQGTVTCKVSLGTTSLSFTGSVGQVSADELLFSNAQHISGILFHRARQQAHVLDFDSQIIGTAHRSSGAAPAGTPGQINSAFLTTMPAVSVASQQQQQALLITTVSADGRVSWRGRLPTGVAMTGSSRISDNGSIPIYQAWARPRASFMGSHQVSNGSVTSTRFHWISSSPQDLTQLEPIDSPTDGVSAYYRAPGANALPIEASTFPTGEPNVTLSLYHDQPRGYFDAIMNRQGVVPLPGAPAAPRLTHQLTTGEFTGSIALGTDIGAAYGLAIPRDGVQPPSIRGYFRTWPSAGWWSITAK